MGSFHDEVRRVEARATADKASAERESQARSVRDAHLQEEGAQMLTAAVEALREASVPTRRFYLETSGEPPTALFYGRAPRKSRIWRPSWYIPASAPALSGWQVDPGYRRDYHGRSGIVLLSDGSLRTFDTLLLGKKQRRDDEQRAPYITGRKKLVSCPEVADSHPAHIQLETFDSDSPSYAICGGTLHDWLLQSLRVRVRDHIDHK